MNKINIKISVVLAAIAGLSSCIGDLNTLPLNENDFTSETAYVDEASYLKGLSYINAYWSFVSQNDPGASDLNFKNAGQSELARQFMILNELSTNSLDCSWGDDYIQPIQDHNWTSTDNAAVIAVYTRALKGITLANEYLLQTEDGKLSSRGHDGIKNTVAGFRAEARFHRAMYNYVLMDLFGNPPFALPENIGGENPKQIQRADLFNWIEGECLELLEDGSAMPKRGEVAYPRPTQGSVAALLARMYLNAEVYTGTARWEDAKKMAEKVISMGYKLHGNYRELFMEDNTTNGASEEFIFAIEYDREHARSWGGSTTLCSAAFNENMQKNLIGILGLEATAGTEFASPETWNGYHVSPEYVANFELSNVTWGEGVDKIGFDMNSSDKRACLYNGGQTEEYSKTDNSTGWKCWKWLPVDSKGAIRNSGDGIGEFKISSSDFPIFRLAEIYLIYAEADARMSGGTVKDAKAISYLKALRDRAGLGMPANVNLDWILKERACELMWEGHRRTDLIRYGRFIENGKKHMEIYPIIMSDLNANAGNLVQNPGY